MNHKFLPTCMAAVSRAEYLALAVFRERQFLEIRQHRLTVQQRTVSRLNHLVSTLAFDYGVQCLILEPDSELAMLPFGSTMHVEYRPLRRGEHWIFGTSAVSSERDLCRELVARYPELKRFVTVYHHTGNVAMERWTVTQLFAAALGLAYAESIAPASLPPSSRPYLSSSSPPYASSTQPRDQRHTDQVGKTAARTS